MKILFAAGIYPPQIGGPAQYAYSLNQEFKKLGVDTYVLRYSSLLGLPFFIRGPLYFLKLLVYGLRSDVILGFDSLSVGLPSVLAGRLLGKKVILRLGGDFLWEQYIERTREKIPLSQFYKEARLLSRKEKVIFFITRFVLQKCDLVVFTNEWIKEIFVGGYDLKPGQLTVIENAFEALPVKSSYLRKNFIWAGRQIFLKNIDTLKAAFIKVKQADPSIELEIIENLPQEELMSKIKACYAIVYPSISEVSPNFVLEALAYGKPGVITKETGYKDLLRNVSVFVDPLSEEDLTQKILFLGEEKNYQKLLQGIQGFSYRHTYTEIAEEYIKLFKKLL